jgi:hypothetical protein
MPARRSRSIAASRRSTGMESWAETKRKAVEEVARVLRGETPRNPVNRVGRVA